MTTHCVSLMEKDLYSTSLGVAFAVAILWKYLGKEHQDRVQMFD